MKRKDNQRNGNPADRNGKYRTGVGYTVDTRHNRHNRQGTVAADDTVVASTAGLKLKPAESVEPEELAEPRVEPTLPFTLKNMTDLVIAYESYRKLEQSIMLLTDNFFPDNPILEGLRRIDEIMLHISPVFNPASPAVPAFPESPASGTIPAVPAPDTVDDPDEDEHTDYDNVDDLDEDFDYDMFSGILDNPMIGAKEKAEILMGMVPVDRATVPAV